MSGIRGGRATCTLLRLRCGVPPRQTQTNNDASGSPQRVAGRPPEYPPGRPLRNRSQAMGITQSQVTKIHGPWPNCRGFPWEVRQRDFTTAYSSRMAGFYEQRVTCYKIRVCTSFTAGRPLAVPYGIAVRRWERKRGHRLQKNTRPTAMCVGGDL